MKIDKYTIYAQHVERAVELKTAYPSVKSIKFHVLNTNAWRSDRHKEFTIYPENPAMFYVMCPMVDCGGYSSGIDFRPVVAEMIQTRTTNKRLRLWCGGQGELGTTPCEWYVDVEITVDYN